jgi:hypothetical protein
LTGDLQLRQAQTEAPGSPATIPRGDEIGTAHLTRPSLVRILKTTISTTADVKQLSPEASPHDGNRAPRA